MIAKNDEEITPTVKVLGAYPALHEKPELLRDILLPLELRCLTLMIEKRKPMSTNTVYYRLILEIVGRNKDLIEEGNRKEKDYVRKHLDPKARSVPNLDGIYDIEDSPGLRHAIKFYEGFLVVLGIPYPSYLRVGSTLRNLEKWGFLLRRSSGKGRAKAYWILNPEFTVSFGNKFDAIKRLSSPNQ